MSELAEWLLTQVGADEEAARAAHRVAPGPWETADRGWMARLYRSGSDDPMCEVEQSALAEPNPGDLFRHLERWDPTRVLAECAAKRKIIADHKTITIWPNGTAGAKYYTDGVRVCASCGTTRTRPCRTLRFLAAPFADRPGYRQEWAPE